MIILLFLIGTANVTIASMVVLGVAAAAQENDEPAVKRNFIVYLIFLALALICFAAAILGA